MSATETGVPGRAKAFSSLLMLVLFAVAGLLVGQFLALLAALPFTDMSVEALQTRLADPTGYADSRLILLVMQAVSSICTFMLFPLLFWHLIERRPIAELVERPTAWLLPFLAMCLLIVPVCMPIVGYTAYLNDAVEFPESLAGLEATFREMETRIQTLTKFLVAFEGTGELLLGLLVVAVLPGIGEELLFRGLMQPYVHRLTGNQHVAIWVTAFIFSAIHMQFYGLLPRMMLGAMFGYLFAWSGSIWIAAFAHFVHNGLTLLLLYLHQQQQIPVDIENPETFPAGMAAAALLVALGLLQFFRQILKRSHKPGVSSYSDPTQ